MAKVQGKKVAAKGAKTAPKKPVRAAARVKAVAKKLVAKVAPKAVAKPKPKAKPAPAPRAAAKPAPKSSAKPAPKPSTKPAVKVKSGASKPVPPPPTRAGAKPLPSAARPTAPTPIRPTPIRPVPGRPVPAPGAARPAAVTAETDKKRARRSRPRVQSSGAPAANWLNKGDKPRPSSFIPAPARAEAPSLIAAPPASSDRLISAGELTEFVVRTVPVRVDIEQGAGRFYIAINPDEVTLRVGEGIEWDFRYIGGADTIADDLTIEFEKPSPFPHAVFRSRRPGTARPHRQLSGPAQKSAVGKRLRYTIRAFNIFKTELASARPWVLVVE